MLVPFDLLGAINVRIRKFTNTTMSSEALPNMAFVPFPSVRDWLYISDCLIVLILIEQF